MTPTSFDALAHDLNLSDRMRDLNRIFFRDGLAAGRGDASTSFRKRAAEHNLSQHTRKIARAFYDLGTRIGARQVAAVASEYRSAPDELR